MTSSVNQPVPFPGAQTAGNSNLNGVIFASASRNETDNPTGDGAGVYVSAEMQNMGARGVDLFVDTTSSATGTLTVKVQKKDPVTDNWYDITGATTVAINDPADVLLTIYPGIAETANLRISNHLGLTWRVHATVATAAVTFSIGAVYLK
jgi:hypothetical protein